VPVLQRDACLALLVVVAVAAGCGDEESPRERYNPDPAHAAEVARDPYRLTCGDIAEQSKSPRSQELVIEAEFALADAPALRPRVREMTENRVGRSIYWAMTDICKGRDASFAPGRAAVEAVRRGQFLVQPRPESWNHPEPGDFPKQECATASCSP
jgi:hypothetical protein